MPWRARDAKRHINGLTGDQSHAWAVIANAALREYGDEGRAIRTANSRVKRVSPGHTGTGSTKASQRR